MRQNRRMEQQDPVTPGSTPPPASSNKIRIIAVAVTAIALLAISIPFVFQAHPDGPALADAQAAVTPVTSHDIAGAETPSCMADAKPANFDFKMKDLEGKEVSLASF